MTLEQMIALIAKNNAGEQEAIEGYFLLLSAIKENKLPVELYNQIQEIISDEMNHTEVLTKWQIILSKIKPNET